VKRVDASELTPYLDRAPLLRDLPSPVVVGCSGGADSVALLVLAVAAALDPVAVTVDHGLRVESAGEAARVAELAAVLGVGHRVVSIDVAPGANLEARARDARLSALSACAEELGAPSVLLGHTADDRAETMLVNLLRGAGVDGLASVRRGLRHPILDLRRSETEQVCRIEGLEPFIDPSNADPAFVRNRIRREVLPLLADVAGRDPVPLLTRQADVFASVSDHLRTEAAALDVTDASMLRDAPPAVARVAVREWLRRGVPEIHPPDAATVERVLAVARGESRATDVGAGRRVERTDMRLRLVM